LLILLFALGLRLIAINQSFWLDEAVQIWASQSFNLADLLSKYMPGDFNPPLYHLITWTWVRIFNPQEWVVRLIPVLLGTASIYLFHLILKQLNFKKFQLTATTLLLATSPLHLYYSHENRMYMLASFAVLLTFHTLFKYLKQQSTDNFILFSLSLIILGFSHFLALFTLPIIFIYGYTKLKSKIIFPFFPLATAYLIYSPLLLKQLRTGLSWQSQYPVWQTTVGSFSLKAVLLLPLKFTIGRISWQPEQIYLITGGLLTLIFWGTAFLGIKQAVKKNNNKTKLIYSLLFIPPLIGLLISPWISVFSYFRFLYLLPFFYLAIGLSKTILHKKLFKPLAISLIIINLILSSIYLFNPEYHRENWKGMINWLHQQNQQKAPVIILSQINKPFMYYDQNKSNTVYVSNPNKLNLSQNKIDDNQVYLVSYGLPIFDPNDKIREKLKENNYTLNQGKSFRKVGIEVWQVNN
jgi:uncharacterized membrane protein